MKRFTLTLTILLGVLNFGIPLQAQLTAVQTNDIIRITEKAQGIVVVGYFAKQTPETLFVRIGGRLVGIPWKDVRLVESASRIKHYTREGMLIGALTGALVLGAYFYQENQQAKGYQKVGQLGAGAGVVLGALSGGIIGAMIGQRMVARQWQVVYQHK